MSFRTIVIVTLATLGLFMGALHAGALACLPGGGCGNGSGWTGAPGQGYPGQDHKGQKSEEWWKSGSAPGALDPASWGKGWDGKPQWMPSWDSGGGKPAGKPGGYPQGKHGGGGKSCGSGGGGGKSCGR